MCSNGIEREHNFKNLGLKAFWNLSRCLLSGNKNLEGVLLLSFFFIALTRIFSTVLNKRILIDIIVLFLIFGEKIPSLTYKYDFLQVSYRFLIKTFYQI